MQRFLSLGWYDDAIEFLFRFVAKTSEPLLALGLVISAADFLSKGALMQANPPLTMAWAWCQAVAIEASSGVVFVYALQSFKQQDKIKAWLYLILSVLLAITGGAMLLFQLIATTTGLQEANLSPAVFYSMAVLRVLVSVSYVYLCRAKHIRFTDLQDVSSEIDTSVSDETMQLILGKLAKLDELERVITEVRETPVALIGMSSVPSEMTDDEMTLEAQITQALKDTPDLSTTELAAIVGVPRSTTYRVARQVKRQMGQG